MLAQRIHPSAVEEGNAKVRHMSKSNACHSFKSTAATISLPPPHSETGWSYAWVLHGPDGCAVVSLNK